MGRMMERGYIRGGEGEELVVVVGRGRCHLYGGWLDISVAHLKRVRHRLHIFVAHERRMRH